MKTKNKKIKISFAKIITISTAIVAIVLTLTMADLFSSLITVGGFSFTNNDILISNYNLYAVCTNKTETKAQSEENSNICKIQGGAGYQYVFESKYYTIASIYENQSDAQKVLDKILQSNPHASILPISISNISISNNLSGNEKSTLENALNIFKKSYKQLYDISISLDTSVISEVNAKLSVNGLGSEVNNILSNFTTLFNKQMSNSFLIIKLNLKKLADCFLELINNSPSVPYTSQIKFAYCKNVFIYQDLAKTINGSL